MFGSLVQKLQNIGSPVASPVSSPITSPKNGRRRYAKTPNQRRQTKQEYREVQSEPEDGGGSGSGFEASKKSKIRRKIDKSRSGRTLEISGPFHLQCSKSMGRLDGLKQVRRCCLMFSLI
ncbi:hypothetical protein V9T40_011870 [Parthenolecanium corni]|uniref:Uncharacterized protein n=1 Tax=Parthenolecanium corni TaxID=536013 RepID=A0AAN9XYY7_9HEMI